MGLYGELVFLGKDVPEQQQGILYASKLIFTASDSWLGKKSRF